jgi:hypothetical protein
MHVVKGNEQENSNSFKRTTWRDEMMKNSRIKTRFHGLKSCLRYIFTGMFFLLFTVCIIIFEPFRLSGEELPEYQQYDEKAMQEREKREQEEFESLKSRYNAVVQKLERIEELEEKSKELQWEGREKWNPRKARIARQEKEEVDRELETLSGEKEDLLKEKEKLERQIR